MTDTQYTNETHDPALRSWVESAHAPATDFPIQNLPLGVFRRGDEEDGNIGVAIGEMILDLEACVHQGLLSGFHHSLVRACASDSLNELMSLGRARWSGLRARLSDLLRVDGTDADVARRQAGTLLVPMAEATMLLPADVGDYTDFYASVHHATNVGAMFRPDNPLLPNYKYVPIGYHGRASSLVPSGTPVRRPRGQTKAPDAAAPTFGPSRSLDYELEVGAFVGPGNALGEPVDIADVREQLFGLCLVNDWSARDVQAWEYQPLGPFLAKNFATTVSPWVVTADALEPFRVPAAPRPDGDPAPLPHLDSPEERTRGGFGITLEVTLRTARMCEAGAPPVRLSRTEFAGSMYWTLGQMLAHHASNGCNLRPGDLIASGTVSGPSRDALGCLLELTRRGADPLTLPSGETRKFLEDGDEVILRGWCERDGFVRIGFGECRGVVSG